MILRLSDGQEKVYNLFCEEMRRGSYSIKLPPSVSPDNMNWMLKLVVGENPWLINYDNCNISVRYCGSYNELELKEVFSPAAYPLVKNRFDEEIRSILLSVIKPGQNIIQKLVAIHDYLVSSVTYGTGDKEILAHVAYGAIVNKIAVCEGIACAFSMLAKAVEADVTVVNGTADGEDHAWNIVRLGGEYYHIDVTWDMIKCFDKNIKNYNYFCVRDCDLPTRKWNRKLYPACNSSRFSYFTVMKAYARNVEELRNIILRQYSKNGELYLKQGFIKGDASKVSEVILNELYSVASSAGLRLGNLRYTYSEEQSVFILFRQDMER